eukprot:297753-Amorphochlora_amoeboformis.AAC.2
MKFLTNPLITLSCVFHIHSGAIATSGPVAPRVGLLTPAHLVTVSSPLMSYQGPNVLTPLRRPDGHQSSGSSSGLLMQAAVTPLDPSNRDDLLSGRPARTLINQVLTAWLYPRRTAARIVYNFRQVLLVLLATLCIMSFVIHLLHPSPKHAPTVLSRYMGSATDGETVSVLMESFPDCSRVGHRGVRQA